MMDVSGSMGEEQKELVRLEAFWIDTWLRRNYDGIESRYIVGDALANYVVDWLADHYAFPSYIVDYVCSPDVYLKRRRGDLIAFTDPEFGWSRVPTTIDRIRYHRGRCIVTLRVWKRYLDIGGGSFSYSRESA